MTTHAHDVSCFIAISVDDCNCCCSIRVVGIFNRKLCFFLIVLSFSWQACFRRRPCCHTKFTYPVRRTATLRSLEKKLVHGIKMGQIFFERMHRPVRTIVGDHHSAFIGLSVVYSGVFGEFVRFFDNTS